MMAWIMTVMVSPEVSGGADCDDFRSDVFPHSWYEIRREGCAEYAYADDNQFLSYEATCEEDEGEDLNCDGFIGIDRDDDGYESQQTLGATTVTMLILWSIREPRKLMMVSIIIAMDASPMMITT